MYTPEQAICMSHPIELPTKARAYFVFMKIYAQIILAEMAYVPGLYSQNSDLISIFDVPH